eukprot:4137812-Amphidinium_carterae.2
MEKQAYEATKGDDCTIMAHRCHGAYLVLYCLEQQGCKHVTCLSRNATPIHRKPHGITSFLFKLVAVCGAYDCVSTVCGVSVARTNAFALFLVQVKFKRHAKRPTRSKV